MTYIVRTVERRTDGRPDTHCEWKFETLDAMVAELPNIRSRGTIEKIGTLVTEIRPLEVEEWFRVAEALNHWSY